MTGRDDRRPTTGASPIVETEEGEVDIEAWDPMPEDLKEADDLDETELGDPMDGPAPTG